MAVNRGKQFENVIKECLERVDNVSVDRIHDQTNGFRGSKNICDFIVYKYPNQFYFECKTVHGNRLPFSNISDTQWQGLLDKSKIRGVRAGVICWWVDKDVTAFIDITMLENIKSFVGRESIRYDCLKSLNFIPIEGKKKRIFFDYDMEEFLSEFRHGAY